MSAARLGYVLWRRRFVGATALVLTLLAGAGFLVTQSKVYESTGTVALLPDGSNPNSEQFYGNVVTNLIPTYDQLVNSRQFLDGVAAAVPFRTTGLGLQSDVHAHPVPDAGLIQITADQQDPVHAEEVAQAATTAFVQQLSGNGFVTTKVFDRARVPTSPVSPSPKLVLGATAVLALALAIAAALAWDRLFGRVSTARDLVAAGGVPVLAVVPEEHSLQPRARVVIGQQVGSAVEEAVRTLRTAIVFSAEGTQASSICVTSVGAEEGKSTLLANLAVVLAELEFQVVILDGDIYRASQHHLFDVSNERGFTSVLEGADPASLLMPTKYPNLFLVPAGPATASRAQEVTLFADHVRDFHKLGDILLVDSPPLRSSNDVFLLAGNVTSVILTVRAGAQGVQEIRGAVASLMSLRGPTVLGTVLNRAKERGDVVEAAPYYYAMDRPPAVPGNQHLKTRK